MVHKIFKIQPTFIKYLSCARNSASDENTKINKTSCLHDGIHRLIKAIHGQTFIIQCDRDKFEDLLDHLNQPVCFLGGKVGLALQEVSLKEGKER